MIVHPRLGQQVQVWYRAAVAPYAPYHGKIGTVEVRGVGKPRNHAVRIGEKLVIVPCGNLRNPVESQQ